MAEAVDQDVKPTRAQRRAAMRAGKIGRPKPYADRVAQRIAVSRIGAALQDAPSRAKADERAIRASMRQQRRDGRPGRLRAQLYESMHREYQARVRAGSRVLDIASRAAANATTPEQVDAAQAAVAEALNRLTHIHVTYRAALCENFHAESCECAATPAQEDE